jgi:hypothetical protein
MWGRLVYAPALTTRVSTGFEFLDAGLPTDAIRHHRSMWILLMIAKYKNKNNEASIYIGNTPMVLNEFVPSHIYLYCTFFPFIVSILERADTPQKETI